MNDNKEITHNRVNYSEHECVICGKEGNCDCKCPARKQPEVEKYSECVGCVDDVRGSDFCRNDHAADCRENDFSGYRETDHKQPTDEEIHNSYHDDHTEFKGNGPSFRSFTGGYKLGYKSAYLHQQSRIDELEQRIERNKCCGNCLIFFDNVDKCGQYNSEAGVCENHQGEKR